MSVWCSDNNLALNTTKTKELVIDFRRKGKMDIRPLFIRGEQVERVTDFKFLGVHIEEDLTRCINTTTMIKKAASQTNPL